MTNFWSMAVKADEKRTDLYLLDEIAGRDSWFSDAVTPKRFKRDLDTAEGTLYVWLDSPGGDAFAGNAIHDMLREYSASGRGRVIAMVSLAASAASVIAMAADEIRISILGTVMIHEPWSRPTGKASVLRAVADTLDTVRDAQVDAYARRTGQPREKILELMEGTDGNGTYMNAAQAMALGFADGLMHGEDDAGDMKPTAMMRALTEHRIAASIDRDQARLQAMQLGSLARGAVGMKIAANELQAEGVDALEILPQASFASWDVPAVLAETVRHMEKEPRSALAEALVAGIRAGLQAWDALRAPEAAPGGPEDGAAGQTDTEGMAEAALQALLSALNDTNDYTEEV